VTGSVQAHFAYTCKKQWTFIADFDISKNEAEELTRENYYLHLSFLFSTGAPLAS